MHKLPCSPSLKQDPQTGEAESVGFCLVLHFQISDIDYSPKYTLFYLTISTIRGCLTDGAGRTVVCSNWLDLGSDTELQIQVKELLFDNAYLSKVVNDKQSWFTGMAVLDLIWHQFFFTTNSLGQQPTSSQYF